MKYLDLLGYPVTDCVTGFKGVVECMSYDLYGCIQAAVKPPMDEKGELKDARWFDCKRLTKTSEQPVLPPPVFEDGVEEAGPAEKPVRN